MSGGCAVLLGVPIDDVTVDQAVDRIMAMVDVGRANGRSHQIATVNVDFLVNAATDPGLLDVLQRTDLAIPDGMPLVWGSRLLGTPLGQRTTGVDLLPALVERAGAAGFRVCLYGGAPGVAEDAATLLRERCSGADVVGLEAPSIASDGTTDEASLDALRAMRADIVGVALGNPKQERWIARNGGSVGAPVYIGIGGTLDFLTGTTRRAPGWMQRTGLEWLHRAWREPRRLVRRYARDLVVFGPRLLGQAWRGRQRTSAVIPVPESPEVTPTLRLLGPTPLPLVDGAIFDALAGGRSAAIDLSSLTELDNVTLSTLVTLRRAAARTGATLVVTAVSPRIVEQAWRLGAPAVLSPG